MTNYNERLYETLLSVITEEMAKAYLVETEGLPSDSEERYYFATEAGKEYQTMLVRRAKQAITSLIKELVAEAKPSKKYVGDEVAENRSYTGERLFNATIDEYHSNLLKALEEV